MNNEVATPAFFVSSSLGIDIIRQALMSENEVDCCFVFSCLVVDDNGDHDDEV